MQEELFARLIRLSLLDRQIEFGLHVRFIHGSGLEFPDRLGKRSTVAKRKEGRKSK